MRSSNLLFCLAFFLLGCNNKKQSQFYSYIERNCEFKDNDSCYIDLKDFFRVNYDTMYVFGEYSQLEGVKLISGVQNYENSNIMMPNGFLVEDSYNKIILIKNQEIVLDEDMKVPYLYDDGIEVKRVGVFDGEPYTHYAKMFLTSKFLVVRGKNGSSYYYVYRNVLNDGSLTQLARI